MGRGAAAGNAHIGSQSPHAMGDRKGSRTESRWFSDALWRPRLRKSHEPQRHARPAPAVTGAQPNGWRVRGEERSDHCGGSAHGCVAIVRLRPCLMSRGLPVPGSKRPHKAWTKAWTKANSREYMARRGPRRSETSSRHSSLGRRELWTPKLSSRCTDGPSLWCHSFGWLQLLTSIPSGHKYYKRFAQESTARIGSGAGPWEREGSMVTVADGLEGFTR